jgi:dipeptide/tripeptide permease
MVGHLYDGPGDPRRDGGFTVLHMGIDIGAFAAPLVIGTVGQNYSWHLGFALARWPGTGTRPRGRDPAPSRPPGARRA